MTELTPEHKLLCDVATVRVHLDKYSRIEQRALLKRVMDHLNAVVEAQRTAPQALAATPAMRDALGEIASKNDLSGISDDDLASAACNALHECELIARAALAATPAVGYFSGCQLRGPGECQSRGMCQSMSCKHAGKVIVKRVCVEPKEAGIVYPKVEAS